MDLNYDRINAIPEDEILRMFVGMRQFHWNVIADGCITVVVIASSLETAVNGLRKCALQSPDTVMSLAESLRTTAQAEFSPTTDRIARIVETGEA